MATYSAMLRLMRKKFGLTQGELAKLMCISVPTLVDMELGRAPVTRSLYESAVAAMQSHQASAA